jgi:hypothetical protein
MSIYPGSKAEISAGTDQPAALYEVHQLGVIRRIAKLGGPVRNLSVAIGDDLNTEVTWSSDQFQGRAASQLKRSARPNSTR